MPRGFELSRLACALFAICVITIMPLTSAAGATPNAPVASFDCGKAPGVDEHIICSDPRLRQADYQIGVAYRAALAASKDAAHIASARADEHGWIVGRNADCQITRFTVVTAENLPGYVDCLLDEYAERLADLEIMRRHPELDPTTVSHPIRRSFIGHRATQPLVAKDLFFAVVDTLADDSGKPRLGWRADGSLLILVNKKSGDGGLYTWRPDHLDLLAHIPGAQQFSRICAPEDGAVVLVPDGTGDLGVIARDGNFASLSQAKAPQDRVRRCGVSAGSIRAGAPDGTVIDVGPVTLGVAPVPSVVTLLDDSGVHPTSPSIRIDSRRHLRATYLPFLHRFIVSEADRPSDMQGNVERRWSKYNCRPYWEVASPGASVTEGCIPFGPYVAAVPEPLPTQGSVFFSAGEGGLYRIAAGSAQQVLDGSIRQPVVSPDGCHLAFTLEKGSGGMAAANDAVIVVTTCAAKSPG